MKKALIVSIVTNILLIILGGYVIHKKGGIDYIKRKLKIATTITYQDRSSHYKDSVRFYKTLPNDKSDIIFLGDSLTGGGQWSEYFGNIKNRGIMSDDIDGVIQRLDVSIGPNPEKIFLMIGINDLNTFRTINHILSNYEKLIILIKGKSPRTQLYLQSILPIFNRPNIDNNDIVAINQGLMNLSEKYGLTYINLFDSLKTSCLVLHLPWQCKLKQI